MRFQKHFGPIVVSLCTERLLCVARTVQNEANSLWGFLNAVAFHLPPIIISWLDPFETNKAQWVFFFYEFLFFVFNRGDTRYHGGLRSRELCQAPMVKVQVLSSHSHHSLL